MKKSIFGLMTALALLGAGAFADGIDWPSDFWDQVERHMSAIAPTPVPSFAVAGFASFAQTADDVSAGTESYPFDTRTWVIAIGEALLDCNPSGIVLFVR